MEHQQLAEIEIADSKFCGYCAFGGREEALELQKSLKEEFPDAAHVPVVWIGKNSQSEGWDEDGEPEGSVGPVVLEAIKSMGTSTIAVGVVRFFKEKLLGVTCGRLPQCYFSIAKLTLHRYFNGSQEPQICDIDAPISDVYGLAAGDCELILNVVDDPKKQLVDRLIEELDFGGFTGAKGEVLPRLQNLQADLSENIIPIYRYPGNYQGMEWETFTWSPTSLKLKKAVEDKLLPLVNQTMNHCVTNYYRDGKDFIAHHSDKDLDLNQEGVIVSLSLGDERILELKRRAEPRDVTRVLLPHGSMLVLGPKTNKSFTHSILSNQESSLPRLSLTLRDVKTFMDLKTSRLYGQGVTAKSMSEIRKTGLIESGLFVAGFGAMSTWAVSTSSTAALDPALCGILLGSFAGGMQFYRYTLWYLRRYKEEYAARKFFTKASTGGTKY